MFIAIHSPLLNVITDTGPANRAAARVLEYANFEEVQEEVELTLQEQILPNSIYAELAPYARSEQIRPLKNPWDI
jgi:hypothetical protein